MIKFGPSGNDVLFHEEGHGSSLDAPEWIRARGLDAYEYSFGQGARLAETPAVALGNAALNAGIQISVHAPYFVSFASPDPEKVENSFGYVLSSLKRLKWLGGTRCVMHTASQGKADRAEVLAQCRDRLTELAAKVREEGYGDLHICPETMGRYSQIGTAEEIIDLCAIDEIYIPCFDFGHINCYLQGGLDSVDAYARILDYAFDRLPQEKVKRMHVHFSKIRYGAKGEINHVTFDDPTFGPEFKYFAEAIVRYDLEPTVICESAGTQARDAATMKAVYDRIAAR